MSEWEGECVREEKAETRLWEGEDGKAMKADRMRRKKETERKRNRERKRISGRKWEGESYG